MQSRKWSLAESVTNVTLGLLISFIGNKTILPSVWDVHMDWSDSAQITTFFACIGLIKHYCVRRVFTHVKSSE